MAQPPPTLTSLPAEVIIRILQFLDSSRDVLNVSSSSRILNACSDDASIWRPLCSQWKFSAREFTISPSPCRDWKSEFKRRTGIDREVDLRLNNLINMPPTGRIPEFDAIWSKGYDARDRLLWHMSWPQDHLDDGLARKWWAKAAFTGSNRMRALSTWTELVDTEEVPLENALAAFDMFIRDGETGDQHDVTQWLDDLADRFETHNPDFAQLSARDMALALAEYLAQNSICQTSEDEEYYDMENNFIGLVLEEPLRKGRPLIYVSIYCCVAERLGLLAQPCCMPTHVYAIVYPFQGEDLDGKPLLFAGKDDPMYIDTYRQFDHEVSAASLRQLLVNLNTDPSERPSFLLPSSTKEVVLRNCRNVMSSVNHAHGVHHHDPLYSPGLIDHDMAVYLIHWVNMVLGALDPAESFARRHSLVTPLCDQIDQRSPWDAVMFETFIIPLFNGESEREPLESQMADLRDDDSTPPAPLRRLPPAVDKVKYRVGTLFHHTEYDFEAVIVGWNRGFNSGAAWLQQPKADEVSDGFDRTFYTVLLTDKTLRYISEDHIGPSLPSPSVEMLRLAGRYFLRWSLEAGAFVNNEKTEYPDD